MKEIKPVKKLTRKQIEDGLNSIPVSALLGTKSRELTSRQKQFCKEIVMNGATKADAYRKAYNPKSKHTLTRAPYILSRDERIQQELAALQMAKETAEHRTNDALRELVIQTLTQVVVNPDAKDAVKVQAAKVLGTVVGVDAFVHRTESRIIKSSEDARTELMAQIRELTNADATDAQVIERDAMSLMAELEGHRVGTPQDEKQESLCSTHIDPHEQIPSHEQSPISQDSDPTPSSQEHPPVDGT